MTSFGIKRDVAFTVYEEGRKGVKAGTRIILEHETLGFQLERPAGTQTFSEVVDAHGKGVYFQSAGRIDVGSAVSESALEDAVLVDYDAFMEFGDEIPGEVMMEIVEALTQGINLSFCIRFSRSMSTNQGSFLVKWRITK